MAAKASPKSKVPGWVWLFTGTVLGAFIMFLIRLSELQPNAVDTHHAGGESVATPDNKLHKQPSYDFYKLLKDSEVPVSSKKPDDAAKKEVENVDYFLQVASYRTANDAEQVRAELLLLNLDAKVESNKNDSGVVWHRVIVGPFDNKSKMAKAQSILNSNRFSPVMVKRTRAG